MAMKTATIFAGLVATSQAGACDDACGSTSTLCTELVTDTIAGCYGSFTSGPIGGDALALCNNDDGTGTGGWHLCESANEAEVLGLTQNDCGNLASNNYLWTLESANDEDSNGKALCYSKYGDISDGRPSDDAWACASYNSNPTGANYIGCGPFRLASDADQDPPNNNDFTDYGFEVFNDGQESFNMQATDNTVTNGVTYRHGVLCCKNDFIVTNPNYCTDIITVTAMYRSPRFQNNDLQFSPYIGNYEYSSTNNRYEKKDANGNVVSYIEKTTYLVYDLVGLTIVGYQSYWAGTSENGNVDEIGTTGRYYVDPELFNGEDQTFFTNGPSIEVRLNFNDCPNSNLFDFATPSPTVEPTLQPTEPTEPTTPSPQVSECENYDDTVYSSCSDDDNCANCQSWGCASCKEGYYKRGNLQRCQSCIANYPNCNTCGDWNGCTSCNSGFTLSWNANCQDETCQ